MWKVCGTNTYSHVYIFFDQNDKDLKLKRLDKMMLALELLCYKCWLVVFFCEQTHTHSHTTKWSIITNAINCVHLHESINPFAILQCETLHSYFVLLFGFRPFLPLPCYPLSVLCIRRLSTDKDQGAANQAPYCG